MSEHLTVNPGRDARAAGIEKCPQIESIRDFANKPRRLGMIVCAQCSGCKIDELSREATCTLELKLQSPDKLTGSYTFRGSDFPEVAPDIKPTFPVPIKPTNA